MKNNIITGIANVDKIEIKSLNVLIDMNPETE